MNEERTIRLFGIREETVRERLADVLLFDGLSVAFLSEDEDVCLRLTAQTDATLQQATHAVVERFGMYLYSIDDTSLEAKTVALLKEKRRTVAVAESCTGGMIASRLTAVPGCSAVFGTGVVSYSWDCKQTMLGVAGDTLNTYGAVSAETAREMADGVRRRAGADIGIATTGEAGPNAAEAVPVGTVFVALADAKRTWVKKLCLDANTLDREGIRRAAASHALDLTRRYLSAYPTVMAGGERHTDYIEHQRVVANRATDGRRFTSVLPWKGTRKARVVKATAWLSALAVLVVGLAMLYNHILTPMTNRELQDDLANLYWDSTSDLTTDTVADDRYPKGMISQFRGLYDMNDDVAGWVRIPDTSVNYPVTNFAGGYYDNHNFNDQFSGYGQPHFYKENDPATLSTARVLAIYGHNTRDEQMFSSLMSYRRIAYLRENPIIEMNTLYANARWEIFAVAVVNEQQRASEFEYMRTDFADEAAFESYVSGLCRRSLFRSDVTVGAQDGLLLLVTNAEREYGFSGARLVVAARKTVQSESTLTYSVNRSMLWPQAYRRDTTTLTPATTTETTTATQSGTTTVSTADGTAESTNVSSTQSSDTTASTDTNTTVTGSTTEDVLASLDKSDVENNSSDDTGSDSSDAEGKDDSRPNESHDTEKINDDYFGN